MKDLSPQAFLITEGRKYGIRVNYITQIVSEIDPFILRNTQTKIVFRLGFDDAEKIAREIGIDPRNISSLKPREFYIIRDNHSSTAIKGMVHDIEPFIADEEVLNQNNERMKSKLPELYQGVVPESNKPSWLDKETEKQEQEQPSPTTLSEAVPLPKKEQKPLLADDQKKVLKALDEDITRTVKDVADFTGMDYKRAKRIIEGLVREDWLNEHESGIQLKIKLGDGQSQQFYTLTKKAEEQGYSSHSNESVFARVMKRSITEGLKPFMKNLNGNVVEEFHLKGQGKKRTDLAVLIDDKPVYGIEIGSPFTKSEHEVVDNLKKNLSEFKEVWHVSYQDVKKKAIQQKAKDGFLTTDELKRVKFFTLFGFLKALEEGKLV